MSVEEPPALSDVPWGGVGDEPALHDVEQAVVLWCRNCGDWTHWVTVEEFNRLRREETVTVVDGELVAEDGTPCPHCEYENLHDFAHAAAFVPAVATV